MCKDGKGVESFDSKKSNGSEDADDEDAVDMWVVWMIVGISIVVTIVTVIIVHLVTKGRSKSRKVAAGEQSQPHTANNSALPMESEMAEMDDDLKRAARKETERQPMQDTNVDL